MASSSRIVPTPQQIAVVRCAAPRLIVEANAGAAKTTTVALRVKAEFEIGMKPSEILMLSYTQPGCLASSRALIRVGVPAGVAKQVRIQTFDEFCTEQLEGLEGRVSVLATPERAKPHVLAAIARARDATRDRYPDEFAIAGDGELAVESLLSEFGRIKGTLDLLQAGEEFRLTPASAMELGRDFTGLAVFLAYERLRRGTLQDERPLFRYKGDATYDLAKLLLDSYGDASEMLPQQLRLVIVDEMHDTNRAMFTVPRAVMQENVEASFAGVGDMDQAIHGDAGADAYFMRDGFDREAWPCLRLPLDDSFRFGPEVASMLGAFAIKPYASLCSWPSRVEHVEASTAKDIRIEIRRAIEERPGLDAESPNGELAVLLRRPSRAVYLENELLDQGIDYATAGFTSYLRRPETLFLRGILACALGVFDSVVELEAAREAVVRAVMVFVGGSVTTTADGLNPEMLAREQDDIATNASGGNFQRYLFPKILQTTDERIRDALLNAMDIAQSNRVEELPRVVDVLDVRGAGGRPLLDHHLAPILLLWTAALGLDEAYRFLRDEVIPKLGETSLNFWTQPANHDSLMADGRALTEAGAGQTPTASSLGEPEEFLRRFAQPLAGLPGIEQSSWYQMRAAYIPLLSALFWRVQLPRELLVQQTLAVTRLEGVPAPD